MGNKTTYGAVVVLYDETAYASGIGATVYLHTPMAVDQASNIEISNPKETMVLPFESYKRDAIKTINMGADEVCLKNFGAQYTEGSLPLYFQNDVFFNYARGNTRGQVLDSFMIHWEDGLTESWESYGCQVKQWELAFSTDEWADQTVEIQHESTSKGTATLTTADKDFLEVCGTYEPNAWYDIGVTVGSVELDVVDGALRIINETDVDDCIYINNQKHRAPILDKRNWEVELTFRSNTPAGTVATRLKTELLAYDNVVFTWNIGGVAKTLTLANMFADPESININEIPEEGFYEYSATWKPGTGFTVTYA